MSQFDDLPIVHTFPNGTESDADLEADRDRKHAAAVADWQRRQHCGHREWECDCWPVGEVVG